VLGVVVGLVNALVALGLVRALARPGDVGWYGYEPMPRRYSDYLPASRVNGWGLLAGVVVVIVLANVVLAVLFAFFRQRRRQRGMRV